ncbi:MAG: ABC transporter permease [Rhodospirillales bacterium]|nr:ABC transporter permease [Rhodospirillales bacterium]
MLTAAASRRLVTGALLVPTVAFLAVAFVVPVGILLKLSLTEPAGPLSTYADILGSWVYTRVFRNTIVLGLMVTAIAVLLGYPTAYMLTRLKGFALTLAVYGVLFPLWISVLIRTFAWILLLEKHGPVNRMLVGTGILDAPAAFLFSNTGVLIGMVHVLLPYAILPIYANMLRIDSRLMLASDGLGASPWRTFRRVYLPLSMPGVGTGAVFVFLLSLGFFITPALLGGANNMTVAMLIENLVNDRLAWPLAAAASFLLLAAVLALLAVTARFVKLDTALEAR